jgi:signal transduction histidine kinase
MLDLTAIEHKGVSGDVSKPVDVVAQLKTAIADQDVAAKNAGLTVEQSFPAGPAVVSASPNQLARAWQNLIGNAVKYGAGGGKVEVTCRTEGKSVLVKITDHGIGISAEDQKRLFTDFFRAGDAVEKGIPGTGLGLSIVKRIVEAAGGTISVESAPGKGSAFTVMLPQAGP